MHESHLINHRNSNNSEWSVITNSNMRYRTLFSNGLYGPYAKTQ